MGFGGTKRERFAGSEKRDVTMGRRLRIIIGVVTISLAPLEKTRGKIGYVFTGDDENTMLWVPRKKVSAGALDDQAYLKEGRKALDKLQVVYRSFSIPRQIISHRASLAPRLVARIKETLVKMD